MCLLRFLGFLPLLLSSEDLDLVFRPNTLRSFWDSSQTDFVSGGRVSHLIGCTSYHNGNVLEDHLKESSVYYYPIFSSLSQNRICFLIQQQNHADSNSHSSFSSSPPHTYNSKEHHQQQQMIDSHFYVIPAQYQLDHSISQLLQPEYQTTDMDLELTLGIGIPGDEQEFDGHKEFLEKIVRFSEETLFSSDFLGNHLKKFGHDIVDLEIHEINHPSSKLISALQHLRHLPRDSCQFNQLTFHSLTSSHISISFPSNSTFTSNEVFPGVSTRNICSLFVASIAVLFHEVTYLAVIPRPTQSFDVPHVVDLTQSIPVDTPGINFTDQNAWIQSGTISNSPYSDMGIMGEGYILGIIDSGNSSISTTLRFHSFLISGVDDMSCFFIDHSSTPTTRTKRNQTSTPVTEYHRRKVIQYVAYADGVSDLEYDHGTIHFFLDPLDLILARNLVQWCFCWRMS
jgi:hypothetical protein